MEPDGTFRKITRVEELGERVLMSPPVPTYNARAGVVRFVEGEGVTAIGVFDTPRSLENRYMINLRLRERYKGEGQRTTAYYFFKRIARNGCALMGRVLSTSAIRHIVRCRHGEF